MTGYLTLLISAVVLVGLGFAGLSLNILLRKNGRFPATSVGRNREMRKRGITCVKHDEMLCHNSGNKKDSCCS